jgi:hypothetical protein
MEVIRPSETFMIAYNILIPSHHSVCIHPLLCLHTDSFNNFSTILPQDLYAATNPPYSDDKDRQRGYNEVLDTKPSINHLSANSWTKECPPSALQAMGNRLLDWFSVVMAEAKRRRTHNKGKGILHLSVFRTSAFVNENMEQSPVVKLTHDKNIVCE